MARQLLLYVTKGPSEMELMFALFDGMFRRTVKFTLAAYPHDNTNEVPLGYPQQIEVLVEGVDVYGPSEYVVKTLWGDGNEVPLRFDVRSRKGMVLSSSLVVRGDGMVETPEGKAVGMLRNRQAFRSVVPR